MWSVFYEEDEDTFGPGTDLVLSIFAMLMILIAFGVQHYQNELARLEGTNKELVVKLQESEVTEKSVSQYQAEVYRLETELENLRSENIKLTTKLVQLEKENVASQLVKDSNDKMQESMSDKNKKLTDLVAQLETEKVRLQDIINKNNEKLEEANKLKNEIQSLQKKLASMADNYREVDERYIALKKKSKILYTIQEGRNYEKFERGKAELTSMAKEEIKGSLALILSVFSEANQIDVVGYASAEPVMDIDAKDENLNLSADRAMIVAHYLASLGIPYECISARGVGRSRSQELQRWLEQGENRSLRQWDSLWLSDTREAMKNYYENKLTKERRIEIRAVYDEESKCAYKP